MTLLAMKCEKNTTSTSFEDDLLLSRSEVEARFGIPKRFLETAVHRGTGPTVVRIGRLVRYRVRDVRDWIDAQAVRSSTSNETGQ